MPINLTSTSHVIRITTDGTENIDVVAAFADWVSGTPFTPGSQETLITTATTTNIVSAPGASTTRMVNAIYITNTSATSANIIVNIYDGSNDHEVGTFDVDANESIVYDGQKWSVKTAQGLDSEAAFATQAEQETGTATDRIVTPGRQHYHPSAAKGWVKFDGTGTIAIDTSYNVASLTDNGVGDYSVNWDTDFSSADYAAIAISGQVHTQLHSTTAGAFRFVTLDSTHSVADTGQVQVIAFGDH